jgi:hypothetical protein
MCETIGLQARASLHGLLVSLALPIAFVAPLLLAKKLWLAEDPRPALRVLFAFALCLTAGSIASECWILRDEARFSAEATAANGKPFSRPRAWPNRAAELVFQPGKGIHSTD